MATIGRSNDSCTPNTSRRSYISTAEFTNDFFSYKVTTNKKKIVGTLGPVEGASCRKCPAGRILRETGRKLYPNANNGVDKYLVGVYDSISLLNGFIDPNSRVFAVYNSDRPTYIPDNGDSGDSVGSNLGPSVLTAGDVISTEGFIGIVSTINRSERYAGEYLYEDTPIVQAGTVCNHPCIVDACDNDETYATLYPDGTIESINVDDETYVRLFANGDTINTGNTSTLGSLYVDEDLHVDDDALVEGNVSTLGNLYVHGSALVDGCISTLGCLYVDEDLVVDDDALVLGNISTIGTVSYAEGLRVPEPDLAGIVQLYNASNNDGYKDQLVYASGCRPNSRVFLTHQSLEGWAQGVLAARYIQNDQFTITSYVRDSSLVAYFIVN